MITKSQARGKWCPMVRLAPIDPESYDGITSTRDDVDIGRCIASACAMWRWAPITNPDNGARRHFAAKNPNAHTEAEAGQRPDSCDGWEFCECDMDPACWVEPEADAMDRRKGYCGLAGKPEVIA